MAIQMKLNLNFIDLFSTANSLFANRNKRNQIKMLWAGKRCILSTEAKTVEYIYALNQSTNWMVNAEIYTVNLVHGMRAARLHS